MPNDQQINLIGHSWGGDTAARAALDNPGRINTLVTIDPVTTFGSPPNFDKLNSSVGTWVNVNATGNPNSSTLDDFTNGNLVAGFGAWNDRPSSHADISISAPLNHGQFDDAVMNAHNSGGKTSLQILNSGR